MQGNSYSKCTIMKLYIKWVVLIINLFAWIGASAADNTVYGRVVNESDSVAISNVKCSLFRDNMLVSSTSTDGEGSFRFDYNPKSAYQIVFAAEGYEETEIRFSGFKGVHNLGLIAMVKPTILDEVTVSGKSRIEKLGKLYVTPSKFQVNASNSSFDLLSKLNLPGLRIDAMNGKPTINSGEVKIYVDGVPNDVAYLKTLKASDVATVEYQDRLPMRYGGGDGGVINIVTKPRDAGGNLYLEGTIVPYLKSDNGIVSFEYHKGASNFGVIYQINYDDFLHDNRSQLVEYISPLTTITERKESRAKNYTLQNAIRLSYTYKPSYNTVFSTYFQLTNTNNSNDFVIESEDIEKGLYTTKGYINNKIFMPARLNLFFKKSMGRHGLEFMFDGNFSHQNVTNNQLYTFDNSAVTSINNDAKGDNFGFRIDGMYNFRIDDTSSLEASYFGNFRFNRNKYANDGSTEHQNDGNHHITLNYAKIFGKFNLQFTPGLSVKTNGNKIGDASESNTYVNPTGRLNLGYKLSEIFRLQASLTVGRRLPELRDYTDHIRQENLYLYRSGNPDLKGQTQYNGDISLHFYKGKFNGRLYASYDYSPNPFYQSVVCLGENYFLSKPINYKRDKSVYVYLDLGANSLWDRVGYMVSVGYSHVDAKGETFHNMINRISLYAQVYFNWRNFTAQYQFMLGGKSLTGPIIIETPMSNTLSLQYRLNSHWDFSLSSMYFLQSGVVSSKVINNQKDYRQSMTATNPEYRSLTWLTITYRTNFGSNKDTGVQRRLNGVSGGGSLQQ